MNKIEVRGLQRWLTANGNKFHILDIEELKVEEGEIVALFGPNGCGKTTLINILSGFDTANKVDLLKITTRQSEGRSIVFQEYRRSLLPWWNVSDNIAFPLLLQGETKVARNAAVKELLHAFGVDLALASRSGSLSGGQAQVVALLRALIARPEVLILDEPFSALDYEAKIRIRTNLMAYAQREKLTILLVSHDLEDALFLSDRTLLLSHRPARIVKEVKVDIERPRKLSDLVSDRFRGIKQTALSIFEDIVMNRI